MYAQSLHAAGRWTGIHRPGFNFWIQKFDPIFSLTECLAQVCAVEDECPGVKTLTLRPNKRWQGFRAGQHVHVSVEVNGRWMRRTWTIASGASDTRIQLTIGKIPDGRVTGWIHTHLQAGAIVKLSPAQGRFVLPHDGTPVVFLAGGAGITPALSMLRTMHARGDMRRFELVHFIRSDAHTIARAELEAIQQDMPHVRIHWVETFDGDPDKERRISAELLDTLGLDDGPDTASWMLCGPQGFMDAATSILAHTRPHITPVSERFAPPAMTHAGEGGVIHFQSGGDPAPNDAESTMLSAIEASGRNPRHGCRAGICFQCTCTKKEGVVRDLRTGELLDEDGESIQICMSQAVGDVTLDL